MATPVTFITHCCVVVATGQPLSSTTVLNSNPYPYERKTIFGRVWLGLDRCGSSWLVSTVTIRSIRSIPRCHTDMRAVLCRRLYDLFIQVQPLYWDTVRQHCSLRGGNLRRRGSECQSQRVKTTPISRQSREKTSDSGRSSGADIDRCIFLTLVMPTHTCD